VNFAFAVDGVTLRRMSALSPLGTAWVIAFCATSDASRAKHFYHDILGLRLVSEDPFALVFDAGGTTLRVQRVKQVMPVPYTTLGWHVEDISTTVSTLSALGVAFERFPGMEQDLLGVWSSPSGARVAWFKDPDGNLLSLTQY
jgi:catechol 2,3-dioxygenase-like lactoylglutathione lyase family enzyme